MSDCKHSLAERETACVDGMCPLCLALKLDEAHEVIRRVGEERDEARQQRDNAGKLSEGFEAEVTDLLCERNDLRSRLENCRKHTIVSGQLGSRCRICKGSWAHSYGRELHESWCPNAEATPSSTVEFSPDTPSVTVSGDESGTGPELDAEISVRAGEGHVTSASADEQSDT